MIHTTTANLRNPLSAIIVFAGLGPHIVKDVDGVDEYLSVLLYLLGYAALAGAAFLRAQFVIAPLHVFTEWVPEVVVELKSVTGRFWSLNRTNSAAVCLVSRAYCVTETGQGLLRWGVIAALLGVAMNGIPFFYRKVEMPNMNKER